MSRRTLYTLALLFGVLAPLPRAAGQIGNQNTDGIAAIVNKDVITFSDVKKQVKDVEETLKGSGLGGADLVDRIKEARLDALRALIERQLIIQEFKNKEFFLPDSAVEDHINELIREQFGGDRNLFIKTLKSAGKSLEQFKNEQKDNFIVQIMRQKFVAEEVIVSPYKIEAFYQENATDFATKDQVKLSLLFIKPALFKETRKDAKGNEIQVDTQRLLADEVLLKLDAGSDFADMARAFSEGANKEKGGDWDWVSRDMLRPELADVAFGLFPGQHSRVIETPDGFYIIKVEDTKSAKVLPIEEVRSQIEKKLVSDERRKRQEQWVNSLKAKAYIKMF